MPTGYEVSGAGLEALTVVVVVVVGAGASVVVVVDAGGWGPTTVLFDPVTVVVVVGDGLDDVVVPDVPVVVLRAGGVTVFFPLTKLARPLRDPLTPVLSEPLVLLLVTLLVEVTEFVTVALGAMRDLIELAVNELVNVVDAPVVEGAW